MKTWGDARHVLCVRLDALGDVLMTTPAIRAVKEGRPDRRVTLLTSAAGAAAGRHEAGLIEQIRIAAGGRPHSLAGRLSLGALAALIGRAPLLISNNTGPAHIAAAMGTPIVDLYALTNPQHTPWQAPARVLSHPVACAYCYRSVCAQGHHLCLRGISPEEVAAAALALLHAAPPRSRLRLHHQEPRACRPSTS